jgi:hypothetical protein
MFGIDNFNYGQTFHAPISDYTDPDDEKYYCIDPDSEYIDERVVWINGDNNITDVDGKLINVEIDKLGKQVGRIWKVGIRKQIIKEWKEQLEEMGFIEDCVKAKQEQNVEGSGGGSGGDSPKCSDTNQETNDDGTCGNCIEGYIVDDDENSDSYGSCIEEEEGMDDMMVYGLLGVGVVILIALLK